MDADKLNELLGPTFTAISPDVSTALNALDLKPDAAILDVGTGVGSFAIHMALRGFDVLTGEPATDTSHYAGQAWAENAEKAGVRDKIRFEPFDAGTMPFASGSFDAVFFFGVLHHVNDELRAAVFKEAVRVSKKSGAVVFFEPKEETIRMVREQDPAHPDPADPSIYAQHQPVTESKVSGSIMDIYTYRVAV